MSHIKYFQMYKTLKKVPKDPYNHTFVPVYVYFEVKFDLSKKSQMVLGGNSTGSRDKDDHFRVVIIDIVGTYLLYGHINNPEADSTYGMSAFLNFFINDIIYTMTGPGEPNPYGFMTKSLNIKHN